MKLWWLFGEQFSVCCYLIFKIDLHVYPAALFWFQLSDYLTADGWAVTLFISLHVTRSHSELGEYSGEIKPTNRASVIISWNDKTVVSQRQKDGAPVAFHQLYYYTHTWYSWNNEGCLNTLGNVCLVTLLSQKGSLIGETDWEVPLKVGPSSALCDTYRMRLQEEPLNWELNSVWWAIVFVFMSQIMCLIVGL